MPELVFEGSADADSAVTVIINGSYEFELAFDEDTHGVIKVFDVDDDLRKALTTHARPHFKYICTKGSVGVARVLTDFFVDINPVDVSDERQNDLYSTYKAGIAEPVDTYLIYNGVDRIIMEGYTQENPKWETVDRVFKKFNGIDFKGEDFREDVKVNGELITGLPNDPEHTTYHGWHYRIEEGGEVEFFLNIFNPADLIMFVTTQKIAIDDLDEIFPY